MSLSDLLSLVSVAVVISAVVYGVIQGIHYLVVHRHKKREEFLKSFDTIVAQLSSDNRTAQLSAAILLRRYFSSMQSKRDLDLRRETINVISALLRTLPTGVYQKTVGDGLAYALDLSGADLQKTNLQDVYLGRKDCKINMAKTDLFMADLSFALVENIEGQGTILYHTILFNTQIKNSDFSNANFSGADLSNVRFTNVKLKGANFSEAVNVPSIILDSLVNGICMLEDPVSNKSDKKGKKIFFSMPGCLSKYDEILTKDYKDILERKGYDVIYYQQDDYPQFGQFNQIRQSIRESSAMIAFGLKQMNIKEGIFHPDTSRQTSLKDTWLPTPWNELEVGMGLMNNLPVLLVKDPKIESGIFDNKLSECFVATISSDFDSRDLETNSEFLRWLEKI